MKKIVVLDLIIYFIIVLVVFYIGSTNAGIWGKWQGMEIVFPVIISLFFSALFVTPIIVAEFLYYRGAKK